jgi:heat shock protein HslJ
MKARTLLSVGLAVLTVACGSTARSSSSVPTTFPSASLPGHTFIATEAVGHKIVPGTMISLAFEGDTLSLNAGCNSMGGGYRINGGQLRVANMSTTEIGCEPARALQDKWLGEFFTAGPEIVAGDKSITLKSGATVVKLTDKVIVRPDVPLAGTRWNVETVISGETASSTSTPGWIEFSNDGRFKASNGCGQIEGTATVHDTTIAFAGKWTILADCPTASSVPHFDKLTKGTVHAAINGDQLTLSGPGWGLGLRADVGYVGPPDCANC